jgi:hypothetical protein
VPFVPIKMLCGDTSRCTTPRRLPWSSRSSWAACNPDAASAMIFTASSGGIARRLPASAITVWSDSPSTHSIDIHIVPPASPTSKIFTTFGCEIARTSLTSSRNIVTNSVSSASSVSMALTATNRSLFGSGARSRATQTVAIPPRPILSMSSLFPSLDPCLRSSVIRRFAGRARRPTVRALAHAPGVVLPAPQHGQ